MKTFFKKTKFMYAGMGMAALLLTSNVTLAAANCSRLVGTWQATYTIGTTPFTDTFTIKNVGGNGTISGTDTYGIPMHGYCKNGVVVLESDYSAQFEGGSYYLDGYHFVNGSPRFARHSGNTILPSVANLITSWHSAAIRKISNVANASVTLGKNENSLPNSDDRKQQETEKLYRLRQTTQ
jgi:hypothetical protein